MAESDRSVLTSVVVPCRGQSVELGRCLRSLVRQSLRGQGEIIVADAAADPEVLAVAEAQPGVRIVRQHEGLSPGAARNLGARCAAGKYLAFIDSDCIADPLWLQSVVDALDAGAVMVGGPVLDAYPHDLIAVADNFLQLYEYPSRRSEGSTRKLPGCNLAIRRGVFEEAGRFCEDLLVGEDTALTVAIAAAWPGRSRFVRSMRVRHAGRSTLRELWRHHQEFGFYRGLLGQEIDPVYQLMGRSRWFYAPAIVGRTKSILVRSLQLGPPQLLKAVILAPLWLTGLVAWAVGFRRGCLKAASNGFGGVPVGSTANDDGC